MIQTEKVIETNFIMLIKVKNSEKRFLEAIFENKDI